MNRVRPIIIVGMTWVLCMSATQRERPTRVGALEWWTPVASEDSTGWVKGVAKEFRKEWYNKMFVHVPSGSSEPSVLYITYVLNVATKQLEEGNTAYARDLVDSALDILDEGVRSGWYSASDIESLKRFIMIKAAEEGLHEPLDNGK